MIQVDSPVTEQRCDYGKVGLLTIDVILARVVLERLSGDNEV